MSEQSAAAEWAARSRSFGPVARAYDLARPSYPPELVDDVVGMLPGLEVADIGAGTGKAARLFAAKGLRLTCVEPDPRMVEVLKENVPSAEIAVLSFEEWQPRKHYDGLISGQAWHWTNPATRYDKAAAALGAGGLLALFWNHVLWDEMPIQRSLDKVYRRHGLGHNSQSSPPEKNPSAVGAEASLQEELSNLTTFSDVELRQYRSTRRYSAAAWCDFLRTTSDHLLLDAALREALLADIARVIEQEPGGVIDARGRCDLYLARRTSAPAGV